MLWREGGSTTFPFILVANGEETEGEVAMGMEDDAGDGYKIPSGMNE